jgi:hypothetical protein
MTYVLWSVLSILAYAVGLVIIMRATPRLLGHSYDESWFLGIAALDILGAFLVFGAITLTYTLFGGSLAIKVLEFVLLAGALFVSLRIALTSLRPRVPVGTFRTSRIAASIYCIFLALASCYFLVQLFTAR